MMMLRLAIALLVQSHVPAVVSPQPAAAYITRAFDTHPLVAFSEPGHGVSGTKEFLAALIREPGFAGTVTVAVPHRQRPEGPEGDDPRRERAASLVEDDRRRLRHQGHQPHAPPCQ